MKSQADVSRLMDNVFKEVHQTREAGQREYAHDSNNALRNFESLATDLKLDRKSVLWIFMKKHLDGILAHINGHKSQREDVRGRIKDVMVYLILLWAMVDDDDDSQPKIMYNTLPIIEPPISQFVKPMNEK